MRLRERLGRSLQVALSRNQELVPCGARPGGAAEHLVIIAPRRIPTIDYYLRDLMVAQGADSVVVFDDEAEQWLGPHATRTIPAKSRVVLVRMPGSAWARVLERDQHALVEVIWLIDDDIPAAREDAWLPDDYRLRLLSDYSRFRSSFEHLIDKVWASTPIVAARFPPNRVTVRPPQPIAAPSSPRPWVTIFYHGTAAHRREHAFLLPIFEQLQQRSAHTVIEVSGDHAVYRMFRGVPRLRVIHPMPWPDYLIQLHAGRYDIGLVPLLDTPFNRARSAVKAIELASAGVRGIVSRRAPYTDQAQLPGIYLAGDDPAEWLAQILRLAGGPSVT